MTILHVIVLAWKEDIERLLLNKICSLPLMSLFHVPSHFKRWRLFVLIDWRIREIIEEDPLRSNSLAMPVLIFKIGISLFLRCLPKMNILEFDVTLKRTTYLFYFLFFFPIKIKAVRNAERLRAYTNPLG